MLIMNARLGFPPWWGSALVCLFFISGCTIKATTDTTTDGTTEFLSSTSGQAWWAENGLVREGQQAQAFVAQNYDHLLPEMAQGEGEYLRAFGAILGVRPGDHSRFSQTIQAHYAALLSAAGAKGSFSLDQFLERIHRLKPIWETAHSVQVSKDHKSLLIAHQAIRKDDVTGN